jgi:hypothetical protein
MTLMPVVLVVVSGKFRNCVGSLADKIARYDGFMTIIMGV